ncbi:MAG: YigZ family protein [Saprospiraceae bacterium]|nr:YigZ family protein [Saprospiraceae bacterium]MDZ4703192.1 YigZ family protein [Saprospiraceae bacterium]
MGQVDDQYHTLAAPCTAELRERASKFLAYAFTVSTEADCQTSLEEVRKLHPKATHHCYAWRLGLDKNRYRANDDGEPGGTAGRPILGQIDSFGLTNVLIVVVRYFGGTKLGTSGLIQAYKASAAEVLQQAEIVEKTIESLFRLTFHYALMNNLMGAIKKAGFQLLKQEFTDDSGLVEIAIRKSEATAALLQLKALTAGLHLEEAAMLEKIEGLDIAQLSDLNL